MYFIRIQEWLELKAVEQSTHTKFVFSINFITKCSILVATHPSHTIPIPIIADNNKCNLTILLLFPCLLQYHHQSVSVCVYYFIFVDNNINRIRMIFKWKVFKNNIPKTNSGISKPPRTIVELKCHWIEYAKIFTLKYHIAIDYYLFVRYSV